MRIDTDQVAGDVEDGLDEAGRVGDAEVKKIGEKWSDTLDGELDKGVKDTGKKMARTITADFDREGFRPTKFVSEFDTDGNLVRRWVTEVENKLERAVRDEVSSGGFKKVGSAIGDAVGSGFNVSGKSPLIAFLIPLIGFIAELVLGAIQAANALTALLTIVPSVVGAIVLQAGVLFLAFKGVGTAIQGAFAAKNADELKKALEGLTPEAQKFVTSLLPLRDVFKDLQAIAQSHFFEAFGNSITVAMKKIGPILHGGIGSIADALGGLGRSVVTFLADPVFTRFLTELIPATVRWIDDFAPAFTTFLVGLANLGHSVTPFLEWFGEKFNNIFADFGQWLSNISTDKGFLDWLERMKVTLGEVWTVLKDAVALIATLANTLDKAGGDSVLKNLADQLETLNTIFASDLGQKAIEGLIHLVYALAYSFIFLFAGIVGVLILFELVLEFLKHGLGPWISDFFTNTIPEFLDDVGAAFMRLMDNVGAFLAGIFPWFIGWLTGLATEFGNWIAGQIERFKSWISSLPGVISDIFGNVIGTLYNAGANLIQGFINGILSKLGPVGDAMSWIAQVVKDHIPHSPAKTGPLSGEGDPLKGGQEIGERLAEGIRMSTPNIESATSMAVSGVVVGAGAVQMNFYGNAPSRSEATAIGGAAGNSLADTIGQRNTRQSVRTLSAA
jgi:phage-related protein